MKLWRDTSAEDKVKILLAFIDGEIIEWSYKLPWKTACDSTKSSPCFNNNFVYRIKPVVEEESLYVFYAPGFGVETSAGSSWETTHRITFNTIDGKPDLNSIKMEEL